jgi:hypothetical protein
LFIALLASRDPDGRAEASRPSPQLSSSLPRKQPSPVETSSPTPEQPSPVVTSPPAPEQPSPQEAAAIVLDTVGEGIEMGEITGHFDHEIRHTIDETSARPTGVKTWIGCSRRSTIYEKRCPKPSRRARSLPQTGHQRSIRRCSRSPKPFAAPAVTASHCGAPDG